VTPAFVVGRRVRIAKRSTIGHIRVPTYVQGHAATVVDVVGEFVIPEDEAFNRLQGRRRYLYRVRLPLSDLWPDHRGPSADTLEVEVFEHWLESEEVP
jgi:hypothetical protein